MVRRLVLLLLLTFTLSLAAAPVPAPTNLDFESGAPGAVPPGWLAPTAHLGYATAITTDAPKQGKQAVRVSGAPKPEKAGGFAFGNVMQTIDAKAEWVSRPRWQLQPLQPRLPKNIAFLTDGRAISYAESWMGIIEAYKLAHIVGETTAGTNGNIN
ncbi:MAG TPA: hypothetical protein VNI54_00310 [Thermoanaerobaculia bacterium]|nr:hypothetical protein [Thermoanaerobaculia bacterium]